MKNSQGHLLMSRLNEKIRRCKRHLKNNIKTIKNCLYVVLEFYLRDNR
jgi:hypothetical protein